MRGHEKKHQKQINIEGLKEENVKTGSTSTKLLVFNRFSSFLNQKVCFTQFFEGTPNDYVEMIGISQNRK